MLKQSILIQNSDVLKLNFQNSNENTPIPTIFGNKVNTFASEFNAVPVWTDGSKRKINNKEIVVSACWFSDENEKNICFNTIGLQTSFNAELQAIEYAILNIEDSCNIIIFTDCKAAIKIIEKYLYKLNCQKTNPTVNRIIELIQNKKLKYQAKVILKHCFSHLLENERWIINDELEKLQQKRIEIMKNEFNFYWKIILFGNQKADYLSQQPVTINNNSKLSIQTKGLPRFIITDSQNDYTIVESNILQVFKKQSNENLFQKWILKCPKRTLDMMNPLINWNKSIWPLLEPYKNGIKNIGNFQHKLCQKVLPTKKLVFELIQQYEKNGWPKSITTFRKNKMKLKYSNNLCDSCNVIANTKHCFTDCIHAKNQQKILVDNLLPILNTHLKNSITSFNWWFSTNYRRNSFGPTLQGWNLELGDYGCLPVELEKFFQQNGFFKISTLLDKLDRILQIHVWKVWKLHTQSWEDSYQINYQQQQIQVSQQQPKISKFFHPL